MRVHLAVVMAAVVSASGCDRGCRAGADEPAEPRATDDSAEPGGAHAPEGHPTLPPEPFHPLDVQEVLIADLSPPRRDGDCYSGMVPVPAGVYTIGDAGPMTRGWLPALPVTQVRLSGFCVDVYEYPNRVGERPLTDVTFQQAAEICSRHGKRLCREEEWAVACRGPAGLRWSYADEHREGACNSDREDAGEWTYAGLIPSGSLPDCRSGFGVYDMVGNVSEYVDAVYDGPLYRETAADDFPAELTRHVVRGGAPWPSFYNQNCLGRHWHPVGFDAFDDDGFRCCADRFPDE